MVCRVCGAANPAQQASCTACGAPLEQPPQGRATRPGGDTRGAWLTWVGLCALFGGMFGFLVVSFHPAYDSVATVIGVAVGAIGGALVGALLGRAMRGMRRALVTVEYCVFEWLAARGLRRLRSRCEAATEEDPEDADAQVRLGAVLWLQGMHDQAERILARVLNEGRAPEVARHNMGVVHARHRRLARAIEELQQALPGVDEPATVLWNLGLAHWGLGQFGPAAEAFRAAGRADADSFPARNALALALARQGDLDGAVAELEEVALKRPNDPDVLCSLGIIEQSRGDIEAADGYFAEALRRDTGHVAARYNRGVCSMLGGYYHTAIEDFSVVSRLAPRHGWALAQRAIAHYRLGQTERARQVARRAVLMAPGDFQVRYNVGTLLLREEAVDQAIKELEAAYAMDPGNIDVIVNLGVATYLGGRLRQALDHFRAAGRMNERHVLARYNAAVTCSMLERTHDAAEEIEGLAKLYPEFPDVYNAIGVIRLLQNRLVEAAAQFRRVADVMPRSALVRANLALTYYLEGDLSAAAEQAHFATNLDPGLPAAQDIAGHVAMDMDEVPEAISHFRQLVALEPSNPDAHSNLGLAYYKDDRLDRAIESYKRALIFAPKSPEGHNDLGLAYSKAKLLDEAARHLVQVIEWQPDNPVVHSNLGLVYYFKGDTEDAVMQWREVTRLSPAYARSREETRFSAYDDREMVMRTIDRRTRASHFPMKVAAFRHSFQIGLDEGDYRPALPWVDVAKAARWRQRVEATRVALTRP